MKLAINEAIPSDELVGKVFADNSGQTWTIGQESTFFGKRLALKKGVLLERVLRESYASEIRLLLDRFEKEELKKLFHEHAGAIAKTHDRVIDEAARDFRKDLLQKVGDGGAQIIQSLVDDHIEHILNVTRTMLAEESGEPLQIKRSSEYLLPPGGRAAWRLEHPKRTVDVFCIEAPPHRRTVNIFEENRSLAFPWICFFVFFKNGVFHNISVFYRTARISSFEDELLFANLPNVCVEFPHNSCGLQRAPETSLTQPNWYDEVFAWYWGSKFIHDNEERYDNAHKYNALWKWSKKNIPQLKSIERWEELSHENPEQMLSLPWRPSGLKVEEFALRALREEYLSRDDQKEHARLGKKFNGTLSKHILKMTGEFRERLEEQLYFLVGHTDVRQKGAVERIAPIVDEHLLSLRKELHENTGELTGTLAALFAKDFISRINKQRNGGY